MRLYLTFFAALFAVSALFAESQAEFFASAMKFFLRRDYPAAKEMFRQTENAEGQYGALSRFYLASIAANEGDKNAYDLFERSLKNPPKDSLCRVAAQYAKFAIANSQYKRIAAALAPIVGAGKSDSLVDWYYAYALYESGEKAKASEFFAGAIKKYFGDANAVGMDVFVEAAADGEPFAKSFPADSLPVSTDVGRARAEIFGGKKITVPQDKTSVLAQIVLAESGADVDEKLLASEVYKFRDAPFAWRGSLVLARIAIEKKRYAQAEIYARDAELLAPLDFESLMPVYMTLGDACRLVKKYDDARYYYQKIFMRRKVYGEPAAESLYKTGLCWFEQGDWSKAHAYFERVFVAYFNFEYWGSRAYYYDARALYSLGLSRDANATLLEYFRRAKDTKSEIYKEAKSFYSQI